MFAEVALKNSGTEYDKLYLYRISDSEAYVMPGTVVSLKFGGRKSEKAIVVRTFQETDIKAEYDIKDIDKVLDRGMLLVPEMLRILEWMKKRYFCTYYDILRLMMPLSLPGRKKTMKTAFLRIAPEKAIDIIQSNELKNIRQIRILENLIENGSLPVMELCRIASVSASMLKTLEKKGYICICDKTYERVPDVMAQDIHDKRPELNVDQKKIVSALSGKIGSCSQELIFGVTGSGKTEIYLRLIDECIRKGMNALVLVPEISLTPQMVSVLRGRFGDDIAIIHSGLGPGERYDSWMKILAGGARIVVGARSAIFSPLRDIGLIVIDEEHETSYKSETTPKYNAREVAVKRAVANGALLVYGSATPLIESYYMAQKSCRLHVLAERAGEAAMPDILLVDMKEEIRNGNNTLMSSLLVKEIKGTLQRGEKAMLLLNRRGFNNILKCDKCGYIFQCRNCSVSMKYHKNMKRLVCHHCGYTAVIDSCPECGSGDISGIGYGTQYAEEELKKIFPETPVFRLDADTQGQYRASGSILEDFRKAETGILTGTQLIAKGHDIEDVTLVGVLNADAILSTDDFRASERTFSLISQIIGRAGRGSRSGKAIIQSLDTQDYSIKSAVRNDYPAFFEDEIKIRRLLGYPPFKKIAIVEIRSDDRKTIDENAEELAAGLRAAAGGCEIIGPYDPFISMLSRKYRARMLLKSDTLRLLVSGLSEFSRTYVKAFRKKGLNIVIDIDPYQTLT